jgi:hypothetical protein
MSVFSGKSGRDHLTAACEKSIITFVSETDWRTKKHGSIEKLSFPFPLNTRRSFV